MKNDHIICSTHEHKKRTMSTRTPKKRKSPSGASKDRSQVSRQLYDEYGPALVVYIEHVWNGTRACDLRRGFESSYVASYDQIDHFIEDLIEALGWKARRETFLRMTEIPASTLSRNRNEILNHLRHHYLLIEREGLIHVFDAPSQ